MKTYVMKCKNKKYLVKALIETKNLILTHRNYDHSLISKSRTYSLSIKNQNLRELGYGTEDLFLTSFSNTSLKVIRSYMEKLEALDLSRDYLELMADMDLKRAIRELG